jgi:hypothetical protein
MCEAYDLADRDDSEGYNAIKVMCSDVIQLIDEMLDKLIEQAEKETALQTLTDIHQEIENRPICWYHKGSGRIRFDGAGLGKAWIALYADQRA